MKWKMDSAHTELLFKVRHMGISTVTGQFNNIDGSIETDGKAWHSAKANVEVDVNSLSTRNDYRDNHLRSDDFFNAERYPKLRFESTGVEQTGENTYEMKGNLTIRDNTHPVTLDVEHQGVIDNPEGGKRTAFSIKGKISRKQFGLRWNDLLATGNAIVADEVKIEGQSEFVSSEA